MKKSLIFCLACTVMCLLTGCGDKFEPTESTVFVTSKGIVHSAVMEPFEESYYDFQELSENVEAAVKSYCLDANEEAVTVDALTEDEEHRVTLQMQYQSVKDYADFNGVLLFSGTFSEALAAGYRPEELYDTEGEAVQINPEEQGDLKVIVTEESICVQTSGRIKYVSDNVTIMDKKLAKAFEAGESHPAFVIYK